MKGHGDLGNALSLVLDPVSTLPFDPSGTAALKALIVLLDLAHQVDLILTLQLHPLDEVLLKLTRVEGVLLLLRGLRGGSCLVSDLVVDLLDHDHHEILVGVMDQILAETQIVVVL